jgi:hypothetical protein
MMENERQSANDLMGHVLALVDFYKGKMQEGNLSASEGAVYLKCLGLLGVSDEISKSREPERVYDALGGLELPFP